MSLAPMHDLEITPITPDWYIGRTYGGTFFARSEDELRSRFKRFRNSRRLHVVATAHIPARDGGNPPSFLEVYGFGNGQKVRFCPIVGGSHDGRIYVIALTGYMADGTPVAWLNGKPGCVSLDALSHIAANDPCSER